MYEAEIFYKGAKLTIMAIKKISPGGRERIYIEEFLNSLGKHERQRVIAFIKKVADNGFPQNPKKFKKLSSHNLWEFRIHTKPQIRIFLSPDFLKNIAYLSNGVRKGNVKKIVYKNAQEILEKFLKKED